MNFASMNTMDLKNIYEESQAKYKAYVDQNLKLNMARGKPCTEQLDLSMDILKALDDVTDFKDANGEDYRNYGLWNGLLEMREIFSSMIDVPASQIVLGNNSSLQIMFEVISRGFSHGFLGCTPWCKLDKIKFLCPVPGYDRHFGITEYYGMEMINIPMNEDGPDMDMVEELVKNDDSIKGIWCVPKYSNPSGFTYSDEVVKRFASLKPAAKDFKIMWDNAYCVHHLTDTKEELLDLYGEAVKNGNEDIVMIFASSSKICFPGAGVAAVAASPNSIKDLQFHFNTQTIGPDKLNQLAHVVYLKDEKGVEELMLKHREILQPKFEKVCEILEKNLGKLGICTWNMPNGGYFVNVDVMDGCAKKVVDLCKKAGVILTDAGATYPYGNDPKDCNIRVAPSFPPIHELETAMELFCICTKLAAIEEILK
ncbi:MAG: aminotransferase [Clostridia bacterium]